MSFVMDEHSGAPAPRRKRRWTWWAAAALLLALVVAGAFVAGRSSHEQAAPPVPRPSSPAPAPHQPEAPAGEIGPVRWQPLPHGERVPVSAVHGPFRQDGPLARGYTHGAPGAALAAINLSSRVSSAAGANTYLAVLSEQATGDVAAAARQLGEESSTAGSAATAPTRWWWAITGGDPAAGQVQVSLIGETPQTQQLGGYAQLTRTLVWREGDWALQVPVEGPQLVTTTAGHQPVPEGG